MKTKLNNQIKTGLTLVTLILFSFSYAQLNTPRGSQQATVTQRVGISDVSITYSRPQVKGRAIWGKLVPYGMNNLGFGTAKLAPWRAGANENTTITFSHDAKVEGKAIKAGTYGLFLNVKNANDVTLILSSNSTSWGSFFYDKNDVVLTADISVKKGNSTEFLTYNFVKTTSNTTTAALQWGAKEISFDVSFDVKNIVLNDIKNKLKNAPGFSRQTWEQAANYAQGNGALELALQWVNASRSGQFFSQKTFANAQIKAGILNKLGKQDEGIKLMDDSLALGTVIQVHSYGRQLIALGLKDKALEVYKWNVANHKNTWPVYYGLGRAYSAKGDFKKAIKYLTKSLALAPAKANKDRVQANIDKLKEGKDIN